MINLGQKGIYQIGLAELYNQIPLDINTECFNKPFQKYSLNNACIEIPSIQIPYPWNLLCTQVFPIEPWLSLLHYQTIIL